MAAFDGTIKSLARISASYNTGNPWVRNTSYDQAFNPYIIVPRPPRPVESYEYVWAYIFENTTYSGVPVAHAMIHADMKVGSFLGLLSATATLSGKMIPGTVASGVISAAHASIFADFYNIPPKLNWVAWSKIGEAKVKLDLTNDAGFRPMMFPGFVYAIKKLGKNAVVYGANGVAELYPVGSPAPTFGYNQVSNIGLLSKDAVAGNEFLHYFIDRLGTLCRLAAQSGKGVERLGYWEFLKPLADGNKKVVLNFDELNKRLFIANGSVGFIYTDSGLGGGFSKLTALQTLGSSLLTASSSIEAATGFEICTDIIDFATRGIKTVYNVDLGTDASQDLYVAVDYRFDKQTAWATTPWKLCNKEGVAFIVAAGIEFRIRVKSLVNVTLELDYLNIRYKTTDKRFYRGRPNNIGEGARDDS